MRVRDAACWLIGVALAVACSDDVGDALSHGDCKDGQCASGYVCDTATDKCIPEGSDAGGEPDPCASCTSGQDCCSGVCVDVLNDPENCSACGNACPGTTCSNGSCSNDCAPGWFDCDGNKANGCESSGVSGCSD